MLIILLISSFLQLVESCMPTTPTTTPAPASCMTCAGGLIMVTADGMGSHPMDMDTLGMDAAGCRTRTFTCLGMNANIEINNGQGVITDPEDGAVDMRALMTVTCNAAGDAWLYMGVSITQPAALASLLQLAETCIPTTPTTTPAPTTPCQTCASTLIMVTVDGMGAKPMAGDVLGMDANGCTTRTFTCLGNMANIEINAGAGVIQDGDDGAVDMTAMLSVTCNAAGTAWEFMGAPITQVECASV